MSRVVAEWQTQVPVSRHTHTQMLRAALCASNNTPIYTYHIK